MSAPIIAPTHDEVRRIAAGWACLEAVAHAIGAEQSAELVRVKVACWQDIQAWFPKAYALTLAECRAMYEIRAGIEKKLLIGADNDTFHYSRDPSGRDRGRELAYEFGQKLVRWNRLMERRFLDRLFNRMGPVEPDKLLLILGATEDSHQSWWKRYLDAAEPDSDTSTAT